MHADLSLVLKWWWKELNILLQKLNMSPFDASQRHFQSLFLGTVCKFCFVCLTVLHCAVLYWKLLCTFLFLGFRKVQYFPFYKNHKANVIRLANFATLTSSNQRPLQYKIRDYKARNNIILYSTHHEIQHFRVGAYDTGWRGS